MAYRKNTIRKLAGPESRKLARLINNLESTLVKLKNRMPAIESMEINSITLYKRLSPYEKQLFDQAKKLVPEIVTSEEAELPHTNGSDPEIDGPLFNQTEMDKKTQERIDELKANTLKADLEMAQHKDQQAMQDKGMME
jgi:hypothetical protein